MQIFKSQTLQNLNPCAPQRSGAPHVRSTCSFSTEDTQVLCHFCFQVTWAQNGELLPQTLKQVSLAPDNDWAAFPPFQPESASRACQAHYKVKSCTSSL